MRPNTLTMAQKDPVTASQPSRPPSGKVSEDAADIREATRSGNADDACGSLSSLLVEDDDVFCSLRSLAVSPSWVWWPSWWS